MAKPLRLLLVEDDSEDALLFERQLPKEFSMRRANDADQARRMLDLHPFDVCFTDYQLGEESGLALVRSLRDEGNQMPIVVLSGLDIEALGENALLSGATDFITKDEICEASIQRVARWALVRRHVQNIMQHEICSRTLAQRLSPSSA